eukprot:721486_1
MAFGFENDVALLNQRYKKKLLKKWNDTLAFIYLEKTYWIEHPMCKLTGANWYKPEVAKVADEFVDWITSSDSNHIADLEQYGLRPFNISQNLTTSIISTENGAQKKDKTDDKSQIIFVLVSILITMILFTCIVCFYYCWQQKK